MSIEETEMCDACDGSGFGVADTYCGKCGGAGGYPMTIKEQPVSDAMREAGEDQLSWYDGENGSAVVESIYLAMKATSHPLEQQQAVSGDVVEQPGFVYFECGDCGFDSVQPADFDGSDYCPLCDGDNNRSNRMARRIARSTDRPEGKDARTALQGGE